MSTETVLYTSRDRVSELLFALHEAAMDAANDPTPDSIRAVQKVVRKIQRELPSFYSERYREREAAPTDFGQQIADKGGLPKDLKARINAIENRP